MRKLIALLLILALVLTVGCAKSEPKYTEKQSVTVVKDTSGTAQSSEGTTAGSTAAAVSELETDLDRIDDLDDEFIDTELDSLDTELDFEI